MYVVVCYDIQKNKVRRKVSRILTDANGRRIQKSVFELDIKVSEFRNLHEQLEKIIRRNDSIACYQLCERCVKKINYSHTEDSVNKRRKKTVEVV